MKLLIVDDEELTRNGLLTQIPWKALGISEVFQADDGVNGLSSAIKNKPEIILCDVRMPRMDGIKMVENLQELLPNTVVIFMSGYSDKQYLKAAIKLRAINYVEKPLNLTEIKDAVTEAMEHHRQKELTQRGETWHYQETAAKLALKLTLPYDQSNTGIKKLCETLSLDFPESAYYTTYLIKLPSENPLDGEIHQIFSLNLNNFLKPYRAVSLMAVKYQNYLVFFILGETKPAPKDLVEISAFYKEQTSKYGPSYICRGHCFHGIANAYQAYESAVILMQSSFFFDPERVLTPDMIWSDRYPKYNASHFSQDFLTEFTEALSSKTKGKTLQLADKLFQYYWQNLKTLANQTKDLYYKLFTILQETRRKMKITAKSNFDSGTESIISYLEHFFSYRSLHDALTARIKEYFNALDNQVEENSTVFMIKEYIGQEYKRENLSVKDISEHVYLSASYACTLFKTETGQTLNQYITEYRMEKAKKLLEDPRYKITDISTRIGYSDGNYFGKSFKKVVGLSPSEYREKMTK